MSDESNQEKPVKQNLRLPVVHYQAKEEDIPLAGPGNNFNREAAEEKLKQQIVENGKKVNDDHRRTNSAINNASLGIWTNDDYADVLADGEELEQVVEFEGTKIRMQSHTPSLDADEEGVANNISFVREIRSTTGGGRHVTIPLWHSGFKITVGDFGSESIFRLTGKLQEIRDNIGLQTVGQIYSFDDVHVQTLIIDFVLDHVVTSTLENWTREKIADLLRMRDSSWLMAGALHSIYPDGYPFQQECSNLDKPDIKCNYSTLKAADRVQDIAKIDFLRSSMKRPNTFGRSQYRTMAKRTVTEDEVIRYQGSLDDQLDLDNVIGPVNDTGEANYKLVLADPAFSQYRTEGAKWISDVITTIEEVIQSHVDLTPQERAQRRAEHLTNYTEQLRGQKIGPWVTKIIKESAKGKGSATDRDTIYDSLGALSEDSAIRANIERLFREYQNKALMTFNGIPNFICPTCKKSQPNTVTELNIIPVSMTQYFFTMLVSRLAQKN